MATSAGRGLTANTVAQWLEVHQRLAPLNLAVGDFDGDGDLDIAYSDWQRLAINIVSNKGGRVLEELKPIEINEKDAPCLAVPLVLAAADLNHDGKSDLVIGGACVSKGGGAQRQYKGFVGVALSCGPGCFQFRLLHISDVPDRVAFTPSIFVGDFNRDQNVDIAFTQLRQPVSLLGDSQGSDSLGPPPVADILMLSGRGEGNFSAPIPLGVCFSSDDFLYISGDTKAGMTFVLMPRVGLRGWKGGIPVVISELPATGISQGVPPAIDQSVSLPVEDLADGIVTDIDNDDWAEIVVAAADWQDKATKIVIVGRKGQ